MQGYLRRAVGVLVGQPVIVGIGLVLSLASWLVAGVEFGRLIGLVIAVVSLGWLGAKFVYLDEAMAGKSLKWERLGSRVWEYIKILLPLVVGLFVAGLAVVLGFVALFARWFFDALGSGENLSREELYSGVVSGLQNQMFVSAFLRNNFLLVAVGILMVLLVVVATFVGRVAISLVVVRKKSLWEGIRGTIKLLGSDPRFFFGYVAVGVLLSVVQALVPGQVLTRLVGVLIGLLLDTVALLFVVEKGKRIYVSKRKKR